MLLSEKIIFDSWNYIKQQEEKARLANIAKLINYYNGDQIQYLKQYLKINELDDFPFYAVNITRRIIRKISEVYKEAPSRMLAGNKNDQYEKIIENKNARMKIVERMANLCGVVGIRPKVNQDLKTFAYDILRTFSAYFQDDDILNPYAIKYLIGSDGYKRVYEYWDAESHLFLDENNKKLNSANYGYEDEENHYGVIPFVFCHRSEVIDDFYNTGDCADDLICANEHINLKLSEMSHKYRFNSFNPPYATGIDEDQDLTFGYNKMIGLVNSDSSIGTLALDHNFQVDVDLIKFEIQNIQQLYGLNINWGMDGATSGFHLMIQNIDHLDDLKGMIEMCRKWEKDIYIMEQIIGKIDGLNVPNLELTVDFSEVKQPMSQEEKNSKWTFEFQNGLSSREDYWRAENPDITDDEIQKRLQRIANENRIMSQMQKTEPTINELFKRNQQGVNNA